MIKKLIATAVLIFLIGPPALAGDKVLATVNGKPITETEVMMAAAREVFNNLKPDRAYDLKRNALDQMIDDMLLEKEAAKKGISVSQLVKQVQDKAGKATESEAEIFYKLKRSRFKDKSFDDVKKQLMAQLSFKKREQALKEYLQDLRSQAKIEVKLQRPRFTVSVDDDPVRGKKDAPITLIEFSDFQCPYCKRARPTVNRILSEYKDKVRYVFRDFPLSFHLAAKPAANAANCAQEQGKYWEYNTELWENTGILSKASQLIRDNKQDEADKFLKEGFARIAGKLDLNMDKFNKCVEEERYFAEIEKDLEEGQKSGVSGTPAYFINGIYISGAQPFSAFKKIIDEELKTKK